MALEIIAVARVHALKIPWLGHLTPIMHVPAQSRKLQKHAYQPIYRIRNTQVVFYRNIQEI